MPKSSMAIRTPIAASVRSASSGSSAVLMIALSVSSSWSSRRWQAGLLQHRAHVGDQVGFAGLPDGQVDADERRVVAEPVQPAPGLRARGAQHPPAQRDDQAGLLGEFDEPVRAEPAEFRVLPADQRLDADGPLVAEPDQRLVVDVELLAVHRGRHRRGQREPGDLVGVAFRVVHAPAALAVGLGPVLGDVGVAHQVGGVVAATGAFDHADAGRHGQFVAADADRSAAARPARSRRWRSTSLGAGGALDQDDELVAAHPGDQPARSPATASSSRVATATSRRSPTSWPRLSLITLKPSRSR